MYKKLSSTPENLILLEEGSTYFVLVLPEYAEGYEEPIPHTLEYREGKWWDWDPHMEEDIEYEGQVIYFLYEHS